MTLRRPIARRIVCLLAPALIGLLPGLAQAESLVDRANRAAVAGPTVLQADPGRTQFRGRPAELVVPGPGERIIRAVPVPHVMNGGGFGLTGNDYYSDAATEGRLGARRHVNDYILAPAYKGPLP